MKTKVKYFIYSFIPVLVLLALAEGTVRLLDLAKPEFITAPLPEEFKGISQYHDELFWSPKVNTIAKIANDATVHINAQGFRGEELEAKKDNEYRILSLGESTTFGAGVEDDETYSHLLAKYLNDSLPDDVYVNVLNCGVSAYSSFQGLKYLELYGLNYKPDMVLLYFEVNDYLPSTLRSYGFDETQVFLTDKQIYESKYRNVAEKIVASSKFLTFLKYRYAAYRLRKLDKQKLPNPLDKVGISQESPIKGRLVREEDGIMKKARLKEANFGQRVSEEERIEILHSFKKICADNDIKLIIIHPSYAISEPHQCILTRFCIQENVKVFEAYPSLHPNAQEPQQYFWDVIHPTAEGHQRLATDLARFIKDDIKPDSLK